MNLVQMCTLMLPTLLLAFGPLSASWDPSNYFSYSQSDVNPHAIGYASDLRLPYLRDPTLQVVLHVEGLKLPTSMAFLNPNDILVLEKDNGTVRRIINGKILPDPLLDVNVATSVERCMCGIAISKDLPGHTYVFLYYTEGEAGDGEDQKWPTKAPGGNRLYRYELVNDKLVNPKLLLDLPSDPGPRHNGGEVIIGPNRDLYITIGDVDGSNRGGQWQTLAQNYLAGAEPDGRSGILRISQDGNAPNDGILGDDYPLNMYYSYGIRNSFGMDFDPMTGNLWATENGPEKDDEINLVFPGFNSGWQQVTGMAAVEGRVHPSSMVDFNGSGTYSDPELVWDRPAGLTAIKFLSTEHLGDQYQNDMLIGDFHNGRLYHFDLSQNRTELVLPESLADKIIKTPQSPGVENIIFGDGFGGVTDMEIGPDGYLYVVSNSQGKIFRIVPGVPESFS